MSLTTANPTTLAPAILDHDAPGRIDDQRRSRRYRLGRQRFGGLCLRPACCFFGGWYVWEFIPV